MIPRAMLLRGFCSVTWGLCSVVHEDGEKNIPFILHDYSSKYFNGRGILLQDIAKKPNMLMDTAKSEFCPVPLQNRVHLLKHTTPNILFIYQICGERR